MRPDHLCAALLAAAGVFAQPLAAVAGDLVVTLREPSGAPVAGAVVTVQYAGGKTPARYAQPLRMDQRDLKFSPFVLVAPVGAEVAFNNADKVRHHVYSFSPAKKFELKLFGRDQSHSLRFDKAGTVALGCNIHDNMVAFIRVTDAPLAAVTDATGRVLIPNVPAGAVTVKVWQPYLRAPDNMVGGSVNIPVAGGVQRDFSAPVLAPRR